MMTIGYSVNILQQTQQGCAALFTVSEQGLQEILILKYMAMKEANRTEQNITAQKYIDQMNVKSIQTSIMRNYIDCFPPSYSHLIQYKNWEELECYVDKIVKNKKEKQ